jgi:hypothetical protein
LMPCVCAFLTAVSSGFQLYLPFTASTCDQFVPASHSRRVPNGSFLSGQAPSCTPATCIPVIVAGMTSPMWAPLGDAEADGDVTPLGDAGTEPGFEAGVETEGARDPAVVAAPLATDVLDTVVTSTVDEVHPAATTPSPARIVMRRRDTPSAYGRTAAELPETFNPDVSTASKADAGMPLSSAMRFSGQPGSAAPWKYHGEPLSASTSP